MTDTTVSKTTTHPISNLNPLDVRRGVVPGNFGVLGSYPGYARNAVLSVHRSNPAATREMSRLAKKMAVGWELRVVQFS